MLILNKQSITLFQQNCMASIRRSEPILIEFDFRQGLNSLQRIYDSMFQALITFIICLTREDLYYLTVFDDNDAVMVKGLEKVYIEDKDYLLLHAIAGKDDARERITDQAFNYQLKPFECIAGLIQALRRGVIAKIRELIFHYPPNAIRFLGGNKVLVTPSTFYNKPSSLIVLSNTLYQVYPIVIDETLIIEKKFEMILKILDATSSKSSIFTKDISTSFYCNIERCIEFAKAEVQKLGRVSDTVVMYEI